MVRSDVCLLSGLSCVAFIRAPVYLAEWMFVFSLCYYIAHMHVFFVEWKRVFGWSTSLSIDELRDVLKFVGGPTREVQDDNSSSNSYVGPEGGIDEPLNTIMDKISVHQNIQGVVVSDTLGYCIAARGNLDSAAAGFLQSILDSAIRLSEDEEYPIISIETDKRTILVSHTDGFTTSILRSHQGDEHKDHQ